MHVIVLGGTGRTGKLIVQALLAQGHGVTCVGRSDPQLQGARFLLCDLMDATALRQAVEGADAVVSALASGKGNPVCSAVARALSTAENLRFVSIGGAGVDAPGDRKGTGDKVIGWLMRRLVGEMLADRQAELAILQASPLRWTMLRPPRLVDGPATGETAMSFDRPASTAITRANLAKAVVAALNDSSLVGRAPFVAAAKPPMSG